MVGARWAGAVLQAGRGGRARCKVLLAAACLAGSASRAEATRPERMLAFDIPAQPLETALEAYSLASGVQVLFETSIARGKRSKPARGFYTTSGALGALLAGTELSARRTTVDAFTVVPAASQPAEKPIPVVAAAARASSEPGRGLPPALAPYEPFLARAQAGILAALCSDSMTGPGDFEVGLLIWIGRTGNVERSVLARSTGEDRRDAAIVQVLQAVRLGTPPPSQLPQPLDLVIVRRPPGGGCPPDGTAGR